MAKKRPGIIIYFDMLPALDQLSDEQLGKVHRASLHYAANGTIPDFNDEPFLKFVWELKKARIDADGISYQEKAASNLFGTYCREAKKRGIEPVSYSFWSELSADAQRKMYENLSNDIAR